MITLNSIGTQQFKQLEERNPGQLADVIWAGRSFGTLSLDLPVPSGAKKLVLGSEWYGLDEANAKFDLLNKNLCHKRNLTSPCGAG